MTANDIPSTEGWKKSVDFHGHVCPGLAIGFRAAQVGLDRLRENRAMDEELVAIVETNACSADAIQVMTGCTFGKSNFIHKDYGKHVFTFASRESGAGVRVSLNPGVLELTERHRYLMDKIRNAKATKREQDEFWETHGRRSEDILAMGSDDLFVIVEEKISLPAKAKIEQSRECDECGEPAMISKLEETHDGSLLCGSCRAKASGSP